MGAEEEEVAVTLSGGAPWGFRLQGGSEQKGPLQVSKIRKRSKACRGGLWENDMLLSVNGKPCTGLSHAAAMQLIDAASGTLSIVVRRAASGGPSGARAQRSPSPRQPFLGSRAPPVRSPEPAAPPSTQDAEQPPQRQPHLENLTSPPDSEAYYAETDSDADNVAQEKQRRARKKSPRSPPGGLNNRAGEPPDEVSLSEMSGYDSTPEAPAPAGDGGEGPGGVAKREIMCQPGSRTDTPFSESEALLQPPEPEDREPSPEALLLPHATRAIRAERHLIPMVGPVEHPVDEDLTTSYAEKAKQAKLHRGESVQEKSVKEAKTRCRTIASLLTDAPNPHSKGVLMFKKRRQRAKKYTLVSFGSVDEERAGDEEDGVLPTSESEFDEEGFSDARSLSNHADWDSAYLAVETSRQRPAAEPQPPPGLSDASGRGAQLFERQRLKAGRGGESPGAQWSAAPPLSPGPAAPPAAPPGAPLSGPATAAVSLHIPAPPAGQARPAPGQARTSTACIYLSTPSRPAVGAGAAGPAPPREAPAPTSPAHTSPAPQPPPWPAQLPPTTAPTAPWPAAEPCASREQRVALPAPRTGILLEARRRSSHKPMFKSAEEKKKHSPNPELLSLVQNLDEKPKGEPHGAGFESGPEEDLLSLGAEACNFMQGSARRFRTPPPVAPKPQQPKGSGGLANGPSAGQDLPLLKGKGAELFAKRQSRMDRFVVEAPQAAAPKPRTPSPAPSLPSSWKYSPNIRAPPPIAYNPLHSPFYPLAASKSQASKAESKVKKPPGQKPGIQAIDFMRHQPYQLNSAMFCFGAAPSSGAGASTGQAAQQASLSLAPAKQAPVKTARTYEIRRFSTPAPMPASSGLAPTVLAPRSATTLDEPVWRTEAASPSAPTSPGPFQVALPQYQSSPELSEVGREASPGRPAPASSFQVARPRFSAAQTGMQAHIWRPGSRRQ
ncbi:synaptopodin 2-like protein [Varanus komodoensis]|uniref:synaptopodin 2-like protein n=1 Tax=Varanus komodoensis TaxID=61221 RepID=UPI001CF7C8D2|nr:synaptopodin 2-like protein [Varanus komodoensis]